MAAAGGGIPTATEQPRDSRGALALGLLVGAELLFVVWFVAVPLWLAGLVLLGLSAWSAREKLLGLLALGTGMPAVLMTMSYAAFGGYDCSGPSQETVVRADGTTTTTVLDPTCSPMGSGPSVWLQAVLIALAIAYLALQVWTLWRLTRRR